VINASPWMELLQSLHRIHSAKTKRLIMRTSTNKSQAPNSELLYVTSFGPDMYQMTGRHLVDSFLDSGVEGRLLICHEQRMSDLFHEPDDRLLIYDLDHSSFLRQWLESNKDIIPTHLGGNADGCSCFEPSGADADHKPNCPASWFNRNASRWFRKIVSLDHALTLPGIEIVVWLDSDCRFRKKLSYEQVAGFFKGGSVFYLKSRDREVMESGIVGFHLGRSGRDFLALTIDRYRSGAFRNDPRWDDGYQFQMTVDCYESIIKTVDLAAYATGFDDVVPNSPIGEYLHHFKGVHGPVLQIMT
jgi:hypothetical protein